MEKLFYLILLALFTTGLFAQQTLEHCAFEPDAATIQWMNQHHDAIARFKADPASSNRLREVKRVPLRFVAFNAGKTAGLSQADVNLAVSNLNKAFLPAGIEFFSCQAPINVISSPYANYLISEERALWQEFKASKVINVFCVESIEYGTVAGYTYLPGSGAPEAVFMLRTHLSQPTFAHEMGHYYGLYHTHGKSNCETLTDELVNGSNCESTGDDVCDTPADPNLQGLGCYGSLVNSATCTYVGTLKDKNGDLFKPNPKNIMSYAPSRCRTDLTPGQYERIRYFSQFRVYPPECPEPICITPNVTKIDSSFNSIHLEWSAFAQDSSYQLRYRTPGDTAWKNLTLDAPLWSLGNLKPCTKLEVQLRRNCGGSFSAWTPILNLKTMGCGGSYCASFGSSNNAWLNRITIGAWTYTSGNNDGYALIPSTSLSFTNGTEYSFQLDPGGTLRIRDTLHWQIWIDKNRDRDFNDSGERVYEGKSPYRSALKGTFTSPADLSAGTSRMRVLLTLNTWALSPCDTSASVIETEDYSVTLRTQSICPTPGAANLVLSRIGTNAVTFKAQGLEVARYQWEIRQAVSGQLVYNSSELLVDSLRYSNLIENISYQVRLRVLCKNGVYSSWSEPKIFSTLAIPCPVPDSSLLLVRHIMSTSVQLNCGSQPGTAYYQFTYRIKGTEAWTTAAVQRSSSYTLIGLRPSTAYEYRVRVYCSENLSTLSPYSKIVPFTTLLACTAPDSITMNASNITHQGAVLKCGVVNGAVFYDFSYRVRNTATWFYVPRVSTPNITLSGLKPSTAYEFRVRVFCNSSLTNVSEFSKNFGFQTDLEPCAVLQTNEFQITYTAVKKYSLSSKRKGKAYGWRWRTSGSTIWTDSLRTDSLVTQVGLKFPQAYDFQAQIQCLDGRWSQWSNTVKIQTPNLTCNAPDSTSLVITYQSPESITYQYTGNKHQNISWRYKASTDTTWTALTGTSGRAPALGVEQSYEFSARGVCLSTGELSPWSRSKIFTKPCPPLLPTDLSITLEGKGAVLLKAQVSASKYRWRYRLKGSLNWSAIVEGNNNVFLLDSLKNESRYEFSLSVQCRNGSLTGWLVKEFTLPCAAVASDIKVERITPYDATLLYQNFNFTKLEWRYRIKNDSLVWTNKGLVNSQQFITHVLVAGADYEVQVRKICLGETNWSDWSESAFFKIPACVMPDSLKLVPTRVIPTQISILASNGTVDWRVKSFVWRYRLQGEHTWQANISTQGNSLDLKNLSPNSSYEIEVDLICTEGTESKRTYSTVIKTPNDCFVLKEEQIKVHKISNNTAFIEVQLPFPASFRLRYRPNDTASYQYASNNVYWNAVQLKNLQPGMNYEVGIQIICGREAEWSLPLFFTTTNCQLPSAGEINILKLSLDSTLLGVELFEYTLPTSHLRYRWAYRLKTSNSWVIFNNENQSKVSLTQLKPDQDYEVSVSIGCNNTTLDSIVLTRAFRNTVDLCGQKPSSSWLKINQIDSLSKVEIQCNLSKGFKLEVRYRLKTETTGAWPSEKPVSITCGSSAFSFFFKDGPIYEVQFRAICPSGNVSAWSEIIVLEHKKPNCPVPTVQNILVSNLKNSGVTLRLKNISARTYHWNIKSTNGSYNKLIRVVGLDSVRIVQLTPGATYQVQLGVECTPYDIRWSDFVEFTIPSCASIPRQALIVAQLNAEIVELSIKGYTPQARIEWRYRQSKSDNTWQTFITEGKTKQVIYYLKLGSTYEFQARQFCTDSYSWSAWSEPAQYTMTECALPNEDRSFLRLIFFQYPILEVHLGVFDMGEYDYTYRFYYRLKGGTSWIDSIDTDQNTINIEGLTQDSTYEFLAKIFCGDNFTSLFQTITIPPACFKIDKQDIKFEYPTNQSISVFIPPVNTRTCEYRYRIKGATRYLYQRVEGFNGYAELLNLSPATTYEISARIICDDPAQQHDWSETVEFTTKACLIPLSGDLAILKYFNTDSVLFLADFWEINYDPNLVYTWKYKLSKAAQWTEESPKADNQLMLKGLIPDETYEVNVTVKCAQSNLDSLSLSNTFTLEAGQCDLAPDTSISTIAADRFEGWIFSVTIPEDYHYQVRFKYGLGVAESYVGPTQSSNSISFGSIYIPQTLQFRLICPNGNVSPWSELIQTKVIPRFTEHVPQAVTRASFKYQNLLIAPNPSNGQFKVTLPVPKAGEVDQLLEVFNSSGQKVISQKLPETETTIDLSAQPSGMYFLRATLGKKVLTERIILQKP